MDEDNKHLLVDIDDTIDNDVAQKPGNVESQEKTPEVQLSKSSDKTPTERTSSGGSEYTKQKKPKRLSRLDKLPKSTFLDKVDEETDNTEKDHSSKSRFGCSDFVGVRSYLHNFYEQRAYKDPSLYEDDEYRYLMGGPYPKRRRCTSVWWKVFVWIGANLLVFGILGVLIGYLWPQKPVFVGSVADNMDIVDQQAIAFNFNLDVCKLVGLVLFCMGGLTLTVALLSPAFLHNYFEEDRYPIPESFKVRSSQEYKDDPPLSPTEKSIPASTLVKNVQPERKSDESIITKEGMLPYHD